MCQMSKCSLVNVNIECVLKVLGSLVTVIGIILAVILNLKYCLRDKEELRSSNCENFNQTTSSCALNSNALDDQLTKFVKAINIQRTRHFIFNLNISSDGLGNQTEKNLVNGNKWIWAIGDRGKRFLSLPYDDHLLSIKTLSLGKLEHSLDLNADDINMDGTIFTDCCMSEVLYDVIQKVRNGLALNKTDGKSFPKAKQDILCRQKLRDTPVFILTKIPGFSLLEIQAKFYYDCFPLGIYSCYCWSLVSFILASAITSIVIVTVIYHYCKQLSLEVPDKNYVNILKIPLLPVWINDKKKQQRFFRCFLVSVPFIFHIVAEICYAVKYGFSFRWNQFGVHFKTRSIIYEILIYIAWIAMLVVVCLEEMKIVREPRLIRTCLEHFASSTLRYVFIFPIFFISAIFLWFLFVWFCSMSAFLMLMTEVMLLTSAGIAIHIRTAPSYWINIVAGTFHVVSWLYTFLDRYQLIFKSIYSIGSRIDKEGYNWKIFRNTRQSYVEGQSPELSRCEIKYDLLRKIIEDELPSAQHVTKNIWKLFMPLGFIIFLGVFVHLIDKNTKIWFVGEYALTVTGVLLAKLPSNRCSARNKQHNLSQARQLALEEKLREYASTGKYPSTSQQSCCSPSSPQQSCCSPQDVAAESADRRERPLTSQQSRRSSLPAQDVAAESADNSMISAENAHRRRRKVIVHPHQHIMRMWLWMCLWQNRQIIENYPQRRSRVVHQVTPIARLVIKASVAVPRRVRPGRVQLGRSLLRFENL
ncbi:uncharacterized protein [Diadema antillarum]|uniref:uncharacterized protein isoform X2 n=1 Tax=Diadema antillarum TaxID=105358 RepID=UPI003A858FA9